LSSTQIAILSDIHLAPDGTPDSQWNNIVRLSESRQLLDAALADIVASGHTNVLLLGDLSHHGDGDSLSTALQIVSDALPAAWVVPGNHDVASSEEAFTHAVHAASGVLALQNSHQMPAPDIVICGHGLRSTDGGQTCTATALPDARPGARLLVWAGHYPLFSQESQLTGQGMRYPGDLLNLPEAWASLEHFIGPALVLHGHLHTAVVEAQGPVLQIGVPAVVEWPYAWTVARIDVADDNVTVQTMMTPINGNQPRGSINTVLDELHQHWVFARDCWTRV